MPNKKPLIVAVDSWVEPPEFDFDHDFVRYKNTSIDDLPERIKDANIVITSATPITREGLQTASHLELVSCNGTGTDHVDKDAVRDYKLSLCRVPAQNTDSVSEHAFALYYTLRRKILEMHALAMDGTTWAANLGTHVPSTFGNQPPRVNAEETLVVVGYGALGKNIERLGKALGMDVLIAERKGASETRSKRVSFEDALKKGTIFIVVTPLNADTRDMFSKTEFEQMDSSAVIVNVGRGGIVNEADLAEALKSRRIAGAATDVFAVEPATKENCPLIDESIPNLVLSPHNAWYSSRTIARTIATVKANIEGWVKGNPQNLVIHEGKDCK